MKWSLALLSLVTLSSCATSDFEYIDHCSKDAYSRVKKVHDLEKKKRRGKITKIEEEIIKKTYLLNREFETVLKPLMFECLAEAERMGNKNIYSICTVTEVDRQGKIAFLDVDDKSNKLEAGLKSCLIRQMQKIDYSRYPGVIAIQAISMDLDP